MKPASDGFGPRARKSNGIPALEARPDSNTPMTLRMATEEMLRKDLAADDDIIHDPVRDSAFGVESLHDTFGESQTSSFPPSRECLDVEAGEDQDEGREGRRRSTLKPSSISQHASLDQTTQAVEESRHIPSPPRSRSQSLTSLSLDSLAPLSSSPSSPKSYSNRSLRPSDDDSMDDGGSHAIVSSSDDDANPTSNLQGSAPQLIMPSIKMPSRRPFTERGKDLGRIKVLIAGDSGVGKTSLIKSVVQTCEDIVHVDPLAHDITSVDELRSQKSKRAGTIPNNTRSTQHITEIHASTKAYPPWWSDIEETKVLRRRKGAGGDTVLERNICFVDTPGYSQGMSRMEGIESIVHYVESQWHKSFSASCSEGESVGLLSGSGGCQVDVVFYLIANRIKHEDIVFLQRLSEFTNVLPLIAKSDTLSHEEIESLRRNINEQIRYAQIRCASMGDGVSASTPYTTCSAFSDDNENMDASLLMSPDYVQPLISSQLEPLLQKVFDKDVTSYLRHVAAMKLVRAQRRSLVDPKTPTMPRSMSNTTHSHRMTDPIPPTIASNLPRAPLSQLTISPYVQARIADHTQQEERLAQIKLAKWASDLHRSLQKERAHFEDIANDDRAAWLTEKLGECSDIGAIASTTESALIKQPKRGSTGPRRSLIRPHGGEFDAGDPLHLLQWSDLLKSQGWIMVQIMGSFGLLGAAAVWISRSWDSGSESFLPSWSWWGR